jgi:hypothetical protein
MDVQSPAPSTLTPRYSSSGLHDVDDDGEESSFTNARKHSRSNSNTLSEAIHGDKDADSHGRAKAKQTQKSTAGGMEVLASLIVALSDSFRGDAEDRPTQIDLVAKAIQLLEEEINLNDECAIAVEVVTRKPEWITTYLGFRREGSHRAWLTHLIAKEADNDS